MYLYFLPPLEDKVWKWMNVSIMFIFVIPAKSQFLKHRKHFKCALKEVSYSICLKKTLL